MKIQEAVEVLRGARLMVETSRVAIDPRPGTPADKMLTDKAEALDLAIKILSDMPEVAPARSTDPSTSREAAEALRPTKSHLALLSAAQQESGSPGFNVLSAESLARRARIAHQRSYWKRISELKKAGLLAVAATATNNATGRKVETYRITEKGRAVLRDRAT